MNAQISEEVHTLCRRYQALALSEDPTTLTVALSEEAPQGLLAALRFATGKRIHLEQWPAARLELALNQRHEPLSAPLAARRGHDRHRLPRRRRCAGGAIHQPDAAPGHPAPRL